MLKSTRFKISIFAIITLTIFGMVAYVLEPDHLNEYALYNMNTVVPILGYIVGRSYRTGRVSKGLVNKGSRYRTAFFTFLGMLIIGFAAYLYSPEYIDNLATYMISVVMASTSYIIGKSFKEVGKDQDMTS